MPGVKITSRGREIPTCKEILAAGKSRSPSSPCRRLLVRGWMMITQFEDAISKGCSSFEFEVLGGLLHLFFEFFEYSRSFAVVPVGANGTPDHLVGFRFVGDGLFESFFHRLGGDPVNLVVIQLDLPASFGLIDGSLHRSGHAVCIEDHLGVYVASAAADGLNETGL